MQIGPTGEQLDGAPFIAEQPDRLGNRGRPIVGEVLHDFPPFLARAASTLAGLKGAKGTRTPRALWTALAMAAAVEIVGGSPMPMTPRSGISIMCTTTSGMSRMPPSL